MKRGKVPSIFREAPKGVEMLQPVVIAPATKGNPAAATTALVPARFWVQHDLYPAIKKACSTNDAPGIRRQNAPRVLHELRQAKSLVEKQLMDFQRNLRELEEWMDGMKPVADDGSNVETTETKKKRKKKKHKKDIVATPPHGVTHMSEGGDGTTSPISVDHEPGSISPTSTAPTATTVLDIDNLDMDVPCTTTECWQFVHAAGFFTTIMEADVDMALAPFTDDVAQPRDATTPSTPPPNDRILLSEKLLAALMELRSPVLVHDDAVTLVEETPTRQHEQPPLTTSSSPSLGYDEKRLQKELAVLGLWDDDDDDGTSLTKDTTEPIDDEITARLRQLEHEDAAMQASTHATTARLRERVTSEWTNPTDDPHVILKRYRKMAKRKQDARRRRRHLEKKALKHR
ncbi:Aste57867_9609 [Aphanomyces stellatus]|uniref:Aste57867_9609 protein n=1 Tax=Aphanomyces stellatus TaxID=120398 RepID=A0A485KNL3_9STRA|nr:hypothetical protein As57867_009571 [Aphanomyces stellatus]VFT86488.1 Aste57867_9609 [Aphanomyces stellatus]